MPSPADKVATQEGVTNFTESPTESPPSPSKIQISSDGFYEYYLQCLNGRMRIIQEPDDGSDSEWFSIRDFVADTLMPTRSIDPFSRINAEGKLEYDLWNDTMECDMAEDDLIAALQAVLRDEEHSKMCFE